MNLKNLFCRRTFRELRKISSLRKPNWYSSRNAAITPSSSLTTSRSIHSAASKFVSFLRPNYLVPARCVHTLPETYSQDDSEEESEEVAAMNDFLSRFVWIMRGKLSDAYPESDKNTIDAMLLIIVEQVVLEMENGGGLEQRIEAAAAAPSEDFSPDLWKTVWEVSNVVLDDMKKAQKKEKMKNFLQSEEVKEMSRFAGEIGIRGDMLRELRFKWAREKMEESEFYEGLERLRQEETQEDLKSEASTAGQEQILIEGNVDEEKPRVVSLPKRHGKLKYKIYGLDLSDPKWSEVADKIHETEKIIWPQEAKPITGKCKIVTEKILSLQVEDDPSELFAEWKELLQPTRIDWIALLDRIKERNSSLYFKIAEILLAEDSFQSNIGDYSKLVDAHASANRLEDAERILGKMSENGILPDFLTLNTLVFMYSKAGNLEQAEKAFKNLRSLGRPDMRVYYSMIMTYVNSGKPKLGERLMRDMETKDIKPTKDIYMALLRAYSQCGDVNGTQRLATSMEFAGFEPNLESFALLIEAFGRHNDAEARNHFDYMIQLGIKPDDRCTAGMIAAYERKNALDKALSLLLELEKDGFEPGIATYAVLLDWFSKMLLVDEAEQVLNRISELGEAPPLNVHISLCDLYSRARIEKKALQALGVVESKKDQLGPNEFERIIVALMEGGFDKDAERMNNLMQARGFSLSDSSQVTVQMLRYSRPAKNQAMKL